MKALHKLPHYLNHFFLWVQKFCSRRTVYSEGLYRRQPNCAISSEDNASHFVTDASYNQYNIQHFACIECLAKIFPAIARH